VRLESTFGMDGLAVFGVGYGLDNGTLTVGGDRAGSAPVGAFLGNRLGICSGFIVSRCSFKY
jgi:hypothetical protein